MSSEAVRHVLVSAKDLATLAPGQKLFLDLGAERVVYHVVLEPALDLSRIVLITAEHAQRALDRAIEAAHAENIDLTTSADGRLLLTGDPTSFEALSPAQVDELRARGSLVTTARAGAPKPAPQTVDPCDHYQSYSHVRATVDGAALSFYSALQVALCGDRCTPGSTRSCYSGPPGTSGVGLCHGGEQTCRSDGLGYGPCVGEVVPRDEVCTTPEDESCDGVGTCAGTGLWSGWFGDTAPSAVVLDDAGDLIVGGAFRSSVTLAGVPLTNDAYYDGFVVKLGPTGTVAWLKQYSGVGHVHVDDVAIDAVGNVVVVGEFYGGAMNYGPGSFAGSGSSSNDGFIIKYASDGTLLWARAISAPGNQAVYHATVDAAGNIAIQGGTNSVVDVGAGPLDPANGDSFIAYLDPSGATIWSRSFFGIMQAAIDSTGAVLLGGNFTGTYDLGAGPMVSAGGYDAFVAKLSPSGALLWSKHAGAIGTEVLRGIAVDGMDNLIIAGETNSHIDWGTGPVQTVGDRDVWVAKLDPSGSAVWTKLISGPYGEGCAAVSADASGSVAIAVDYQGTVDFGAGPIANIHDYDIALARFSPGGTLLWTHRIASRGADFSSDVAIAGGLVALAGKAFSAPIDTGASVQPPGGFAATFAR